MIQLKTSVLLAASLQLGAMLTTTASNEDKEHLYQFGLNLGTAFQIQDDYLDAFGNEAQVGKEIGGDIKQNKKTFLLIYALQNNKYKNELIALLNQESTTQKVQQVLNIYQLCKADEYTNNLKETYTQQALQHLQAINISAEKKQPLIELANYLMNRNY